MPAGLSSKTVRDDLSIAEERLKPAHAIAVAVAVNAVLGFARLFGLPADPEDLTSIYRKYLGDLPADLLIDGVDRVLAVTKDSYRLPMPGLIRDAISADLANRQKDLIHLRVINARLETERREWEEREETGPRMTVEQLDEFMREVYANLKRV